MAKFENDPWKGNQSETQNNLWWIRPFSEQGRYCSQACGKVGSSGGRWKSNLLSSKQLVALTVIVVYAIVRIWTWNNGAEKMLMNKIWNFVLSKLIAVHMHWLLSFHSLSPRRLMETIYLDHIVSNLWQYNDRVSCLIMIS